MNFVERFSQSVQTYNLNKIRPLGIELFHADGQTDTTTVAFRNFANAPQKICIANVHVSALFTYKDCV